MRIFVSGVCGFVGSELALGLRRAGHEVCGCDNFIRSGSQLNQARLEKADVEFWKGDVRFEKDLKRVKNIDWVIDAAANPSVLAGVDGKTSSRDLLEHNLWGTVNLLEVCKREDAGLILLSTSRVYSIEALCGLPVTDKGSAFVLEESGASFRPAGITENFSTSAPISLYGASKLASEQIALEYGSAFGFPVWVNRCGVMAGAGQFGKPDQGIFSFWIHSWARQAPLKYIGFGGTGHQVRDCLHPEDLLGLVLKQLEDKRTKSRSKAEPQIAQRQTARGIAEGKLRDQETKRPEGEKAESEKVGRWEGGKVVERRIFNVSGGMASAMSLRQLSDWCTQEFGPRDVAADLTPRPFDLPWVVLDSARAEEFWHWKPRRTVNEICGEIAQHARENPEWLAISRG
jgi:CDP-paratose 2-epimerase